MARDVQQEISQTLKDNPVVLYMKGTRLMPQCGFSHAAVQMLDQLGIPYRTVDVLADPEIRAGIKTYGQWPTVPQLYVAGELIGGSDIMRELFSSGELAEILKRAASAA